MRQGQYYATHRVDNQHIYRLLGCISPCANADESLVAAPAEDYISLFVWICRIVCATHILLAREGSLISLVQSLHCGDLPHYDTLRSHV